jgi:ComF family protein
MLKECLKATRDLFFPAVCFKCGQKISRSFLCEGCEEKIDFFNPPLCRLCSKPIKENTNPICKGCWGKRQPYSYLISITAYKEPMSSIIHDFKYRNCDWMADFLSEMMINHLLKIGFTPQDYDLITCVPMHYLKLKERGYNQASLLARKIANHFKITFRDDIIYQTRYRKPQAPLTGKERKKNIENCFLAKGDCRGKNILLIDDIFTTGSTVKTCSHALKKEGTRDITVVTLSKTICGS